MTGVLLRFSPPPGEVVWPHVTKWGWEHWAWWMGQGGYTAAQVKQYRVDREQHGVAVVSADARRTRSTRWLYQPTPWGVKYHTCGAPSLLAGGAVGVAKSHTMRWDVWRRCLQVPNYRALLFRRTFPELLDNHINDAERECQTFGAKYVKDEKRVIFSNGSWLRFAHCERDGDEEKYLSSEYELVAMDELATFTRKQAMAIISRLRTSKEGVTSLIRTSTNPGGANTLWCVDWFMTHTVTEEDDPYYEATDWAFLPGRLWDNPYLMDRDGTYTTYLKRLGGLGPERRRQLIEGDFAAITGQFFSEFSYPKHVADLDDQLSGHVVWERCMDWGYLSPGVCYWAAILPDGRVYIRHEYKFTQTIVSEVAARVKRQTVELGQALGLPVKVRKTVVDPAMGNKTGATGESMLETLGRCGVPALKGDNDRVMGWQRLRHWLEQAPDGKPWMVVHPSCTYLIRTLPALVSDVHNPEDVNSDGDDHGADAIRYLVQSRPAPSGRTQAVKPQPGTFGWLMNRREGESFFAHA